MMFGMGRLCLLLLAGDLAVGLLVPEPSSAAVERRYALVVGNGDYSAIPGLTSPANDASDIGVALANPRLGVRIRGRARADADALCAYGWLRCHVGHRSSSSTSAVISRAAALSGAVSRASRPAATLSANTMR